MKTASIQPPVNQRSATIEQLSVALQCRPPLVRRLQQAGTIPSYKIGNKLLRFDIPAVIDALSNPKGGADAQTP